MSSKHRACIAYSPCYFAWRCDFFCVFVSMIPILNCNSIALMLQVFRELFVVVVVESSINPNELHVSTTDTSVSLLFSPLLELTGIPKKPFTWIAHLSECDTQIHRQCDKEMLERMRVSFGRKYHHFARYLAFFCLSCSLIPNSSSAFTDSEHFCHFNLRKTSRMMQ